ncbi:hypothetical protein [Sediminimonas qiaohouensis]|uniref:hypothetical protein n=1 Tax=Sediminimonas qiaohouensis TaxID=552061 RepID=UPI0004167E9D|nr:hypothetical protein [Sediminimonas qiaohouensis]
MASAKRTRAQIAREDTARKLAAASALFEHGEITGEMTDQSFILRLNTLVHARRHKGAHKVPKDLADAIQSDKKAKPEAELVLFGHWLLRDGRPGMGKSPGQPPDYREIMKCVAACLVEIPKREDRKKHPLKARRTPRKSRKADITKHDLSDCWPDIFNEARPPRLFDSRLKSVRRLLPAYLAHLKTRKVMHGGKAVTKSPEIQAVLEAITGKPEAHPSQPQATAPVTSTPATPAPFTIPLGYFSSAQKSEHRGPAGHNMPLSTLRYACVSPSSTSSSGKIHPGRDGKIVLAPDVTIRGTYKVDALIDRIAILFSTVRKIDDTTLNKQIKKETGRSYLVRDLTKQRDENAWGKPLREPDPGKRTGFHFALLIQDPAPEMLSAILDVIRDGPGIDGAVTVHMIEVSVDFYPTTGDPQEAIQQREQMVGLLQRHHWAPQSCFLDPDIRTPRHIDARQIYDDPNRPAGKQKRTRYLFADTSNTWAADGTLDLPEIRDRILTQRAGEDLYLNATFAKGGKHAAHHVTIQHKIADQRNPDNDTMTVLPDHDRRARVEVTISGSASLQERGLNTIDDLGKKSFRRLTRPYLTFKLGTTEPWQHLLEDAQAQMRTRGVYGLALRHRARALEEREQLRASGQKLPRNQDREGLGLKAWEEMNVVTGKALDELTRRWRGFSWS